MVVAASVLIVAAALTLGFRHGSAPTQRDDARGRVGQALGVEVLEWHGSTSGTSVAPGSASASGATVCTAAAVERTFRSFIYAFNHGNRAVLKALFATKGFMWYATSPPGARTRPGDRATLVSYFARRHGRRERLLPRQFEFGGIDHGTGAFTFELVRKAQDVPRTRYIGKGATQCEAPRPRIFVWGMGPKP